MKFIYWILIILLILILTAGFYIALVVFYPQPDNNQDVNMTMNITINKSEIGVDQISYLLYSLEANRLHNLPLSDTPKIEIIIGQKVFNSEVVEGRTKVEIVAGQIELYSKGYLSLYNKLTGKNS